ncbi:acetate--CoA ligase [Candidatus Oleimmundimicrobium sp.]|uniref:acetate--CoA ligase n=1 Tax=Candidatus Oleimmundimicrobium sp. TaxID=3060597 RepID=UPI0027204C74|nr:acetate--CoA ligase [Candidatus Oleimmundimicrobium sp.]MDO8885664.1 acetate--CoA ligase [Candidatus Oleimmundimicrobium sp.]
MGKNKEIDSMMREERVFYPPKELSEKAYIKSMDEYEKLYKESVEDTEGFWGRMAEEHLSWFRKWDKVLEYDFSKIGEVEGPYVEFFKGGKLNASYNCLDRHLNSWRRNKAAIIWQGEKEEDKRTLTYQQLHSQVCRFAHVLKKHGVKKGDRVTLFLPMIPELAIAMLACARIGAIHSIVFSAFSADALKNRILDCESKLVVAADVGYHKGKVVNLKEKVDEALRDCSEVEKVIIIRQGNSKMHIEPGRDHWWHKEMDPAEVSNVYEPEEMDAEDPLFILYTSGSTGKPKGVIHTTGGYLLHTSLTSRWIFDIKDEDIFWCTADIGWITGHSYIVYGPLSIGATVLMFEGVPTYPEPDRFWEIIEENKVNIFYTAPTVIRALMRMGDDWPNKHDLSSLRVLGTVGEPINPEAWMWYYEVIGKEKCPVLDTWWQTETGGILITPLAGATPTKPGSASKPFFGVVPEVLRKDGTKADVNEGGPLVITKPWPGMLRGMYGDKKNERVKQVYFSMFPGKYFTADGCRVDEDGFYWLMGRIDDVINVSGHRIGTAEVESALVSHESVAEAAVVGFPHEIKGQGIYCYVTLKEKEDPSDALKKDLVSHVRKEISSIATPDKIQFTDALPKTRSGKIMRRILRKIAEGEIGAIGDTSTLADPSVVDALVKERQ